MDSIEDRIRANRKLALVIAHECCQRYGLRYDDAYADALIGLWQAAEKWSPDRGVKFSTFASHRIRGEILDARRREGPFSRKMLARGDAPLLVPLDGPVSDQDDRTVHEFYADPQDSITTWWEDIDRAEHEADIERKMAELVESTASMKERDQRIIVGHINGRSLGDLAYAENLTESRACQIWRRWIEGVTVGSGESAKYIRTA